MKTADLTLEDQLLKSGVNKFTCNVASCKGVILEAMEAYATKQTSDLSTQLSKANSDKEKAVALVKEMQQYIDMLFNEAILDDFSDIGRKGSNLYDQAHNLLTDCGITL
jgi:hypothetical protein